MIHQLPKSLFRTGEQAQVIREEESLHLRVPRVLHSIPLWKDVVNVDGEEDGTHGASLAQSSLQLYWLRQRLAHANLHHRARVQRLDEGVRPPRHSIVSQLREKGLVGYAIVRLLEVHEAEVHGRGRLLVGGRWGQVVALPVHFGR